MGGACQVDFYLLGSADLVIIAITHYTPTIEWPDPPVAYEAAARRWLGCCGT